MECDNLNVMPDVTFTINGVPYTLQPTAYTILVRTVSLFCKSQGRAHMPVTSPFSNSRLHSAPPLVLSCSEVVFLLGGTQLPLVERSVGWVWNLLFHQEAGANLGQAFNEVF